MRKPRDGARAESTVTAAMRKEWHESRERAWHKQMAEAAMRQAARDFVTAEIKAIGQGASAARLASVEAHLYAVAEACTEARKVKK